MSELRISQIGGMERATRARRIAIMQKYGKLKGRHPDYDRLYEIFQQKSGKEMDHAILRFEERLLQGRSMVIPPIAELVRDIEREEFERLRHKLGEAARELEELEQLKQSNRLLEQTINVTKKMEARIEQQNTIIKQLRAEKAGGAGAGGAGGAATVEHMTRPLMARIKEQAETISQQKTKIEQQNAIIEQLRAKFARGREEGYRSRSLRSRSPPRRRPRSRSPRRRRSERRR